jgi:branched-chain amino acid transport system ATP-binding protein
MDIPKAELILECKGLELSFGGIKALDNVGFEVLRGEIYAIIGPNGAGKTCLLNCISGYYRPQKGQIWFEKHDLLRHKSYQVARLGISRTFQTPQLYPQMSALENLLVARYIHSSSNMVDAALFFGRSRQEEISNRKAAEEIILFCGISDLRGRPVAHLSYGQRKQVEIARALAMKPRLLMLDEPMSGLDDMMKEIVAELIITIQKNGTTVILIEHDMEVVMGLSQRILVLDFGEKIAEGTPGEVGQNTRVTEAYLGGNGHVYGSDSANSISDSKSSEDINV